MKNPLILPELRDFIANGDVQSLRDVCEASSPPIVAELIAGLEPGEIWEVLRHSEPDVQAVILSHLEHDTQVAVAEIIPRDHLAHMIDEMAADDRVDLLKLLPEDLRLEVLPLVSSVERADIMRLSTYKEGTAGALMTTDFATLPEDYTAVQAIDLLRRESPKMETIYYAYVVDSSGRLVGFVSLRGLIRAKQTDLIRDIMKSNMLFVRVDDEQGEALQIMQKFDILALPVVNGGDRLMGIITIDDIMDVGQDEATEDFHKMATVGAIKGGLREAALLTMVRARAPWLMILVFMNIFSGAGIAYFEDTIEAVVALVFFLPLLIDSGGNAGSQASTLMVRAMATGDVGMKDWFRLVVKEISVALTLGLLMAAAVISIAAVRAPDVLVPVGLTMVCTVAFGSIIGMSLPFLLTRLKLDPATASAPLITSIADIGGVLIYFSIATWYLGLGA